VNGQLHAAFPLSLGYEHSKTTGEEIYGLGDREWSRSRSRFFCHHVQNRYVSVYSSAQRIQGLGSI